MKRKEHGLLFKAPMILALKNTAEDVWPAVPIDPALPSKWQTRRLVDPQPQKGLDYVESFRDGANFGRSINEPAIEQYGCKHPVGTIIYAKETFYLPAWRTVWYRADDPNLAVKWKPSIFMPKGYSRLWFEVMAVRVERVNTISEADANAEGCPSRMSCQTLNPACCDYAELWDSINGKGDFAKGKWVWVYALRRISQKELARLRAEA